MTFDRPEAGPETVFLVRDALADLLEIHDVTIGRGNWVQLRGRLLMPADKAYALASERLRPLGYTPLLRREGQEDTIRAFPYLFRDSPARNGLAILLLALTTLSMLFVGAQRWQWDSPWGAISSLLSGLPFAGSLLAILGAHELGHYLVSRRYGVPVSLPYFIPMPFSPFGTMGAVVRMKAPPANRRMLLSIAVAGPLAGLAVALPLLIVGLKLSTVGPQIIAPGVQIEGNSLLYAAAKFVVFGRWLPGGGQDVWLHPVAFAAWAGLLVTGLNLTPAGQLDGGHIIYALIGERARWLTTAVIVGLILLGVFFWRDWFIWAVLVFAFGWTFATPLDDITRLDGRGIALAVVMLVLFALLLTPVPLRMF